MRRAIAWVGEWVSGRVREVDFVRVELEYIVDWCWCLEFYISRMVLLASLVVSFRAESMSCLFLVAGKWIWLCAVVESRVVVLYPDHPLRRRKEKNVGLDGRGG